MDFYELTTSNKRRTWLLMATFVIVAVGVGYAFGLVFDWGPFGLVAALVISLIMSFASYRVGDKMVLAISRAREVSPSDEPRLHNLVEGLAIAGGIPKPRVYIVQD
ncbi:MAG: zinc metalloprotease HtpX, partial [Actinomycetota bacterium]